MQFRSPLLVGVALLALAAGQTAALLRDRPLPAGVAVTALPNGYSYATREDRLVVAGFQLQNTGLRTIRVLDLTAEVPGLQTADVVVSGEPFRFMTAGEGSARVPAFDLRPGMVIEVSLSYRLLACTRIPEGERPLEVQVASGGAGGRLAVPLPTAPADDEEAAPDDEDQWQSVLVRDLCG